jgi:hypothetical protein
MKTLAKLWMGTTFLVVTLLAGNFLVHLGGELMSAASTVDFLTGVGIFTALALAIITAAYVAARRIR